MEEDRLRGVIKGKGIRYIWLGFKKGEVECSRVIV